MPLSQDHPALNEKEQRVLAKLQNTPGLVLAHGLGTGKTRSSIQTANQLGKPTTVVVPAALQDNYKKELTKWLGSGHDSFDIASQQAVARTGLPQDQEGGTLVVDEAHRAREPGSALYQALKDNKADKRLLLSASPVYNKPADLSTLVNLAAGENVLPTSQREFNERYVQEKSVSPGLLGRFMGVKPGTERVLTKQEELGKILQKYVDYEPTSGAGDFPSSREETVKVPMSKSQQEIYDTIMNKAPLWVRWKVKSGLPPNRKEISKLQAFLSGTRQVSNSDGGFKGPGAEISAPKIEAAVNYLKEQLKENPNHKAVVYSNYLKSGLSPYKQQLDAAGIPYGEFTGDIDAETRDQLVRDYNADKLKALLISSAGAEGLDLKGTRLLQILEPHFNKEKERQIAGRAVRYKSHAALPEDQRNVLIQKYMATPRTTLVDKILGRNETVGVDEYISRLADNKEQLNSQILKLIEQYGR